MSRDQEQPRRRLDDIFGDVLPETTADERDWPAEGSAEQESWYERNRPPHHDRD